MNQGRTYPFRRFTPTAPRWGTLLGTGGNRTLMAENDTQPGEYDVDVESEAEPDFDRLVGVITDGFIGALGGLVGTVVLTVGLLIASSLGAFELSAFEVIAELVGANVLFERNVAAVGFVLFLLGGMTVWPLLLVSIGNYLPGDRFATKGLPFGFVLWTGFAPSFYTGQSGLALALYLVITLFAHFFYGFALGSVFDYFSTRPDTLV